MNDQPMTFAALAAHYGEAHATSTGQTIAEIRTAVATMSPDQLRARAAQTTGLGGMPTIAAIAATEALAAL